MSSAPRQRRLPCSERLRRTFSESFSVMDVAEPIVSLDENATHADARALMERTGLRMLGVRRDGRVEGYVETGDVDGEGTLADCRGFAAGEVFDDSVRMEDVLTGLAMHDRVFVRVLGDVAAVVSKTDLEKPPMRMWLFGIITLVEMNTTWAIEQLYPDETWVEHVAPGRVARARELQAERERRGRPTDLLACLQISDKTRILIKDDAHREQLGMASRRDAERRIKEIEALRNNLAHAQPIVDDGWETILMLSIAADRILTAEGVRRLVAGSPDVA